MNNNFEHSDNSLSVSELAQKISQTIKEFADFSQYWITGEISGCKKYPSGHIYFSIKDSEAQLKCVIFKNIAAYLNLPLKDGMKVRLKGMTNFYPNNGSLSYIVKQIEELGKGDLYQQFVALKEKLKSEGLFVNNRPLPILPKRVGVITSPKGSVIQDIRNVSCRRFPGADILLYPAAVQGQTAAAELTAGVLRFNQLNNVDVIIVARGGGSIEDLWCFNDEKLARAIYNSKIPVVSAVGHETDFTIADFVADHRAPTPSAAAELVWPLASELKLRINGYLNYCQSLLDAKINNYQLKLAELDKSYSIEGINGRLHRYSNLVNNQMLKLEKQHPEKRLERQSFAAKTFTKKLNSLISQHIDTRQLRFALLIQKLEEQNPMKVLSRGYGLLKDDNDQAITKIRNLQINQKLNIYLQDGFAKCQVLSTETRETRD